MIVQMFTVLLLLLVATSGSYGCGTGVGGGNNEYELLEDPVFTMDLSPAVGWTYFPVKASDTANVAVWFFPGQANTSVAADLRADTEIKAAMMDALVSANIPLRGVEITNDYNSIQIENAVVQVRGVGPLYGKMEAGAITQTAIGSSTADLVYAPYSKQLKVNVRNAIATRYNWNIVKNTFMQKLGLNFGARFVGDVIVGKS